MRGDFGSDVSLPACCSPGFLTNSMTRPMAGSLPGRGYSRALTWTLHGPYILWPRSLASRHRSATLIATSSPATGGAKLTDKHLASKIHCVDDQIIGWLKRREQGRRDKTASAAEQKPPSAGARLLLHLGDRHPCCRSTEVSVRRM